MLNQLVDPEGTFDFQPLNMRALDGVNLEGCKVKKVDGKSMSLDSEEDREKAKQFWEEEARKRAGD